jgi:CubicO group peptidase (beta-lactamase class C family)
MRKILLLIVTFSVSFFVSAGDEKSTLKKQRTLFSLTDKTNYFLGDETSRFAWQNMPALFNHAAITHRKIREIPKSPDERLPNVEVTVDGKTMSLGQYLTTDKRIDSLVAIHHGKLVFEQYNSHGPFDRHVTWSITKVIVGATLARLEAQGLVNMQASLATYLPDFKDSDWGDISLQAIADMRSGMDCRDSDGYDTPGKCVLVVDEIFGIMPDRSNQSGTAQSYLRTVKASKPPTQSLEYNSANTLVLGFVIEAVTEQPLYQALASSVWQPMGAESDALIIVNEHGETYAGGGISARLMDIARFGLLYSHQSANDKVLSKAHLAELKAPARGKFSAKRKKMLFRLFDGDPPEYSVWQWDLVWEDGDLYKDGFSGQGIYISPEADLVLAWFGTADKQFKKHALLPIARKLANSLKGTKSVLPHD